MNQHFLEVEINERAAATRKEQQKDHKCNGCPWGSFTGEKYLCMFQRCIKNKGFSK